MSVLYIKLIDMSNQMKSYQCHKKVKAFKIDNIQDNYPVTGAAYLNSSSVDDENNISVIASVEFMKKHKPKVGGYFIEYEDGYESYSPAEPFESGYTEI